MFFLWGCDGDDTVPPGAGSKEPASGNATEVAATPPEIRYYVLSDT